MRLSAYWLANFVYDYLLYALIAIIAALLCTAMKIDALTTGSALTATWLLFMLYGLAYIPFSYICSFIFIEYGNAQAGYYFFTFIMGGMLPILTLLLRILGSDTNAVGRGIAWVLRLFPSFAFG